MISLNDKKNKKKTVNNFNYEKKKVILIISAEKV